MAMYNLNCFLLNSFLLAALVSSCSCQCGDDKNWTYAEELKKCYYRITYEDKVTWSDAERKCQSLGSHLVSIHTQQEDDYIGKLLRKYSDTYTYLGLRRYANSTLSWTDKSLDIELAKNKTASDRSEGCYLRCTAWGDAWYDGGHGSCDEMMAGRITNAYFCQKDASHCPDHPDAWHYNSDTKKCYLIGPHSSDRKSWLSARSTCKDYGATLVSVSDQKENRFIFEIVKKFHLYSEQASWFLGLQMNSSDVWDDGAKISYLNFRKDEGWEQNGKCIAMERDTGKWFAEFCNDHHNYICSKISTMV